MEEKYKVIFLDIDGVLQPYDSKKRFEYRRKFGLESLQQKLTDELGRDYFQYDEYDVAACYCDWDQNAVNRIKKILDETGAKIVISSDWRRTNKPEKMHDFLKIWGLEKYLIGQTLYYDDMEIENPNILKKEKEYILEKIKDKKNDFYDERIVEILHYVNTHNITNYVAIDDRNLSDLPEGHFVKTYDFITEEQADKVIELLNK